MFVHYPHFWRRKGRERSVLRLRGRPTLCLLVGLQHSLVLTVAAMNEGRVERIKTPQAVTQIKPDASLAKAPEASKASGGSQTLR